MNLLIIEDNEHLGFMLTEFARIRGRAAGMDISILLTDTLESALRLLPQADAVICDGNFPTWDGTDEPAEANWQEVSDQTWMTHIPFVLFSGDDMMVALAQEHGVMAFSKNQPGLFDHIGTSFPPIDWLLGALVLKAEERKVGDQEENHAG